jgi:hypothetical protein
VQNAAILRDANAIQLMGTVVRELRRFESEVRRKLGRLGTNLAWLQRS